MVRMGPAWDWLDLPWECRWHRFGGFRGQYEKHVARQERRTQVDGRHRGLLQRVGALDSLFPIRMSERFVRTPWLSVRPTCRLKFRRLVSRIDSPSRQRVGGERRKGRGEVRGELKRCDRVILNLQFRCSLINFLTTWGSKWSKNARLLPCVK